MSGDIQLCAITATALLSPSLPLIALIIGSKQSIREAGVTSTTHTRNSTMIKNHDLTSLVPSSLYMFSQMMSLDDGAYSTFHSCILSSSRSSLVISCIVIFLN